MSLLNEKEKLVQDMIREMKDVEKYIENEILVSQTRLHEQKKRREILQECLEIKLENED